MFVELKSPTAAITSTLTSHVFISASGNPLVEIEQERSGRSHFNSVLAAVGVNDVTRIDKHRVTQEDRESAQELMEEMEAQVRAILDTCDVTDAIPQATIIAMLIVGSAGKSRGGSDCNG